MADRVIFWDIDGTLVKGSLERLFLKYLLEQKHVSRARIASGFLALALRFPLPQWCQVKLAYLRGRTSVDIQKWIEDCWSVSFEQNLFPGNADALNHFGGSDTHQVLLSGTLEPLAERLGRFLGVTDIIAAKPEIVGDVYSGRLTSPHPHGKVKVERAEEWLAERSYSWDHTTALANHYNDRFLLAKAGRAVVVHPDDRLRGLAEKKRLGSIGISD